MKYLALVLAFLIPVTTYGAISFDAEQGKANGAGTTVTLSGITVTGDILVCMLLAEANGTTVSAMTYSGEAMTQLGTYVDIDDASQSHSVWYLTDPSPTASQSVSATITASTSWQIGCQSYDGVDQDTPFGTATTGGGALADPLTIQRTSTLDGSWMLSSVQSGSGASATTIDSGGIARQETTPSGTEVSLMFDSNTTVANTVTHDMVINWAGGGQKLGYIAAMLLPQGAGGGDPPPDVATSTSEISYQDWILVNAIIIGLLGFIGIGAVLSPLKK